MYYGTWECCRIGWMSKLIMASWDWSLHNACGLIGTCLESQNNCAGEVSTTEDARSTGWFICSELITIANQELAMILALWICSWRMFPNAYDGIVALLSLSQIKWVLDVSATLEVTSKLYNNYKTKKRMSASTWGYPLVFIREQQWFLQMQINVVILLGFLFSVVFYLSHRVFPLDSL